MFRDQTSKHSAAGLAGPKKSLGQHFIRCHWVIGALIRAAEVAPYETIFEVGPGTGILTRALAKAASRVIAVEKDERLAAALATALKRDAVNNVEIITGDILKNLSSISKTYNLKPKTYKLVSNIPYYLTSRLLRRVLETGPQPSHIALTVQKEVAERICAKPPHMNLLALSVQIFGAPSVIKTVPRDCFYPKPHVDSAIIAISDISEDFFKKRGVDKDHFFAVLRTAFGQKRKILAHTLKKIVSRQAIEVVLRSLHLSPTARPEELSCEQWATLTRALKPR